MINLEYATANFNEAKERLARRDFDLPEEIVGLNEERTALTAEMSEFEPGSDAYESLQGRRQNVTDQLTRVALGIPNFPAERVPHGTSYLDNVEVRAWEPDESKGKGTLAHHLAASALGIMDAELGQKITGPRSTILRGKGARLQRALGAFMLDENTSRGYQEVSVPYMVSEASATGTGQLPMFEDDLCKVDVAGRTLYLSPTAEVQLTNMHANTVVDEIDLTAKYTALSDNFRSEVHSLAADGSPLDMDGIFRQHQFPKVELVKVAKPEDSDAEFNELTTDAENILQKLGLKYRIVENCTGDLTFGASYSQDIQIWLPGQGKWREISTCSNFTDWQARRINAKYRREADGEEDYVHTLNGSSLPVGRTMVAILEQYQQEDGTVKIPEALQDYTKFNKIA